LEIILSVDICVVDISAVGVAAFVELCPGVVEVGGVVVLVNAPSTIYSPRNSSMLALSIRVK